MTTMTSTTTPSHNATATATTRPTIAFIGGGNMATAIIGGLVQQGTPAQHILVVEPLAVAREKLFQTTGISALAHATDTLREADVVIWAVKPQMFQEASQQVRPFTTQALHLSVAAGIRSEPICQWLDSQRIIRAMPNTPALIGKGITALYALPSINAQDRAWAEHIVHPTGDFLWLENEDQIDAVTALSGSGPAYMFYIMEAMEAVGARMGLSAAQAHQLTVATFIGAGELARQSSEPPHILRERVTSKGGTTHAAISSLEQHHVSALFQQAIQQAQQRSVELGQSYGSASDPASPVAPAAPTAR
jgi:pyrroline-5-carboxylate reductase